MLIASEMIAAKANPTNKKNFSFENGGSYFILRLHL
jgi:hypothetical protein